MTQLKFKILSVRLKNEQGWEKSNRMATQEVPEFLSSQDSKVQLHIEQFPQRNPRNKLTNSYILGEWESIHTETGRKAWDTFSPSTPLLQQCQTIKEEHPTPSFSLRREGFVPHIWYPSFQDMHPSDGSPKHLASNYSKEAFLKTPAAISRAVVHRAQHRPSRQNYPSFSHSLEGP